MSENVIEVNNVTKIYKLYDNPIDRFKEALGFSKKNRHRPHYALNNVSFNVERGDTVGIIGTNGSGKSTILKIITGVLNPSSGNVNIKGRISALLELGAGFNVEYTGIENVYLNGTMIGFSKEEIDEKLDSILEFADIGDFINQPVKTYSSGMFIRLAFAVAVNIDPEILIVDEALSVGDVFFQAKCYHKFEEFKKQGKTILFVSHDLSSIQKYCNKVILLNQGVKLAEGNASDMIDLYKKVMVNQQNSKETDENNVKINSNDNGMLWSKQITVNPNKQVYGNGMAEIIDFGIFDDKNQLTNNILKGSFATIRFKVKFYEKVFEPVFALTFKDLKGTDITGTNTMYEKIFFDNPKKDDVYEISFKQKIDLVGGEHLISLGVTGFKDGEFTVYNRIYDACNLNVISDKNCVGYYDCCSEIRVIKNN